MGRVYRVSTSRCFGVPPCFLSTARRLAGVGEGRGSLVLMADD
jgi:hypothetical protein